MTSLKQLCFLLVFFLTIGSLYSQDQGVFSGGFEANANFFMRDSAIGASGTPQYDNQLFGTEGWFNLNYQVRGFDMGIRFDYFNNSNLRNPNESYSDEGIGRWFLKKKIGKLGLSVGYLYDQIGSGIIFRAYEERPLLIDNALYGARATYDLSENWQLKAFTGRQKSRFDVNPGSIKGVNLEGFINLGKEKTFTLAPGFGFVNRTLNEDAVSKLVDILKTYTDDERVAIEHNTYLATFYNTMVYDKFTWYLEAAYKSPEVFRDPLAPRTLIDGTTTFGAFIREPGYVLYSSIGYATSGLGITVEAKRTENFNFRTDPTLTILNGLIDYIPPMNRQNTYRLTSRYSPATQDLSELAYQVDVRYSPSRKLNFLANFSNITDLEGNQLYQEIYAEVLFKKKRDWQITGGLQLQKYNQEVYEVKPEVPEVQTVTPFVDFLYRFTRKKSLRVEAQYMLTDQDFGEWMFLLAEVGLAPHWLFEVSMMYNVNPNPDNDSAPKNADGSVKKLVYPTIGIVYSNKANRFSARYVKQVEGIVCSGGICRLEPAFSGVKMTVTSNF